MWLLEEKLCVIVFVVCVYHMSDMTCGKIACLAFSFSQPVRAFSRSDRIYGRSDSSVACLAMNCV